MSTWTPEAIRALGVTTDLPTLGKIFRISRTRAYQMAHTGEWEQAGIRIVPLGSRYVVAVQSILEVLGHGDAGPGYGTHLPSGRPARAGSAEVTSCPGQGQVAGMPSDLPPHRQPEFVRARSRPRSQQPERHRYAPQGKERNEPARIRA